MQTAVCPSLRYHHDEGVRDATGNTPPGGFMPPGWVSHENTPTPEWIRWVGVWRSQAKKV